MKRWTKTTAACLAVFLAIGAQAHWAVEQASDKPTPATIAAGAHFVSVDGKADWTASTSDKTPCSPETAFAQAQAGDTVYFRAGTYKVGQSDGYKGVWGPAHSGTKEKPIAFAAYPGEKIIFAGKAEVRGGGRKRNYRLRTFALGCQYQSYIIFDGFHFVEQSRTGFCGVIISRGCDNRNRPENWVKGCVVRNCVFDGGDFVIGSHPEDNPNSGDNNEVIRIEETQDTLIQNCRMWGIKHVKHNHNISAVKMYYNKNTVIENCEIYDSTIGIFDKGRSAGSVFRNNYIHDGTQGILLTGYGWKAAKAPNGYFMCTHTDVQIINNVLNNVTDTTGDGSHSNNLLVRNNTFYAGEDGSVGLNIGNGTNKQVYNNIFFGKRKDGDVGLLRFASSDNKDAVPQTPLKIAACDHNQFGGLPKNFRVRVRFKYQKDPYWSTYDSLAAWQAAKKLVNEKKPGEGSLDSDPKFVNKSGAFKTLEDFRLAADSPCKGAGRDGQDMGADIDKVGCRLP